MTSRSKVAAPAGRPKSPVPPSSAAPRADEPQRGLRRLKVEHALVASGLASAVASCGFAAFMIAHNTGRPDVQGGQYFSVFAQIDRHQRARAAGAAIASAGLRTVMGDIDPIVTGSIAPREPVDPSTVPLPGFSLREAFDGTALIDSPSGVQVVHAGSILVGVGRVTAIERRGTRVVVVTERGIVSGEVE